MGARVRRARIRAGFVPVSLAGQCGYVAHVVEAVSNFSFRGIIETQNIAGSPTFTPNPVSRKSKSQPSFACLMCRANIQP